MEQANFKNADRCLRFESLRQSFGDINLIGGAKTVKERCEHCAHWSGGSCELFLARS